LFFLFLPCRGCIAVKPVLKAKTSTVSHLDSTLTHQEVFKFMGRIIGLALAEEIPLSIYFTLSFCKSLLYNTRQEEVSLEDLEVRLVLLTSSNLGIKFSKI
jgi:hypothetical protein